MNTTSNSEISNNGWQNIGIFYIHMRNSNVKLTGKQSDVYMDIVRYSVGYGQPYINQMSQEDTSKLFKLSKPTLNKAIKVLEDSGLVQRVKDTSYIFGGGSKPERLGPVFPKNRNIWIKKNNTTKHQQKQISDYTKEEINSMSFNEKYFLTHGKEPDHLEI